MCVCVCVCVCARACVCACVCACVRVCAFDPHANPNENYGILENIINKAKDKNIPKKSVRFNKYKHCKFKWKSSVFYAQSSMTTIYIKNEMYTSNISTICNDENLFVNL